MTDTPTPPVALTIGGSDPAGSSGIQADLSTFSAFGVHGTSAITALTVQNTTGVHGMHAMEPHVVTAQAIAVLADMRVSAVKTGLLATPGIVSAVGELAAVGVLLRLVVDPVLVTASQEPNAETLAALKIKLLRHAWIATPNIHEAAALLGREPATGIIQQRLQARALLDLGPSAVVVTGLVDGSNRIDVLATHEGVFEFAEPTIVTKNTKGVGATFSAAVTAGLAQGMSTKQAVIAAREFVRYQLITGAHWRIGRGQGPVSHIFSPEAPVPRRKPRQTATSA
jgi:hydroxymethylpyrimidine/phosphomethylpyrimidine kinase